MVERIAVSAIILVGVFAVFLGVPRYTAGDDEWPNVLHGFESIAQTWLAKTRWIDVAVALLGVVLVGLGVSIFRGAELIEGPESLGWALLGIGFLAMYVGTYVNVRRSGLSSAEATLIGSVLVGVVLLVGIVAILVTF